ncbi:hypothetical protein NDU88_002768 [Pleurodeles waltl]|uniref:Uncharacterized protein n=1 Tax=Pleurodeles waltl TaxID=8319 RepID=A0AAV7NEJ5_PLEWA|nr:hypothetical protein NDU88_002768 [Pleurodeles waltl]
MTRKAVGTTSPSGPGNPVSILDAGPVRALGTTFPSGTGNLAVSRSGPGCGERLLPSPRKQNIDESALPARSRNLNFRPPHQPDDESTGHGGDEPHLSP